MVLISNDFTSIRVAHDGNYLSCFFSFDEVIIISKAVNRSILPTKIFYDFFLFCNEIF
jgi:hypothetical protein